MITKAIARYFALAATPPEVSGSLLLFAVPLLSWPSQRQVYGEGAAATPGCASIRSKFKECIFGKESPE